MIQDGLVLQKTPKSERLIKYQREDKRPEQAANRHGNKNFVFSRSEGGSQQRAYDRTEYYRSQESDSFYSIFSDKAYFLSVAGCKQFSFTKEFSEDKFSESLSRECQSDYGGHGTESGKYGSFQYSEILIQSYQWSWYEFKDRGKIYDQVFAEPVGEV